MDSTLIIQATVASVPGVAVLALALAVLLLARRTGRVSADIRRLLDQDSALLETAGQRWQRCERSPRKRTRITPSLPLAHRRSSRGLGARH
jgi:hypothetical protein